MARLLAVLALVAFSLSAVAGQWTIVNPPTTSAYLNNGGYSGLYKWHDSTIAPLPNRDTYYRYHWRELEPTQDNYDFSAIDEQLDQAKTTYRGKFGFRVMVVDTWAGGKRVPDYFGTSANGWTCGALKNTWVPNWNSALLLTRLTKLMDALSAKYSNDPRLGYVDIGLYGNYGEWHNAELVDSGCFPGPNGWGAATDSRKKAFIDLVTSRFPSKFVALNTNDPYGLCYALSGTRIGLRGDTFSDASWSSELGDPMYDLYRRQYRAAPFISEFSTGPDFTKMKQQALEDHRTNVGNGNFPEWNYQSAAQKSAFLAAAPFIGPRLRLSVANYSASVAPGGCLTVTLTFINDGSSRAYEKWNTFIQLRSQSTNTVAWQSTSVLDIRNVMPKNDGMSSYKAVNSFAIPAGLATGTYAVTLVVKDPTNYRPNFYLAIANPNSDISYTLGVITVSNSAPKPATCATRTPSYNQPKYAIGPGVNSWNDHPVGPLYTDFLMWGWSEELNGASGNVANTNPVWGSSGKSIAFTTQRQWGIWGMSFVCGGINITGYSYAHFRMRAASSSSGKVFFYPYMSPWNNPPSVDLSSYGGDPVSTAWKNYNIPLSAFAGLPKKIDHFVFGGYNNGATFYIDDFSLTDTPIS